MGGSKLEMVQNQIQRSKDSHLFLYLVIFLKKRRNLGIRGQLSTVEYKYPLMDIEVLKAANCDQFEKLESLKFEI